MREYNVYSGTYGSEIKIAVHINIREKKSWKQRRVYFLNKHFRSLIGVNNKYISGYSCVQLFLSRDCKKFHHFPLFTFSYFSLRGKLKEIPEATDSMDRILIKNRCAFSRCVFDNISREIFVKLTREIQNAPLTVDWISHALIYLKIFLFVERMELSTVIIFATVSAISRNDLMSLSSIMRRCDSGTRIFFTSPPLRWRKADGQDLFTRCMNGKTEAPSCNWVSQRTTTIGGKRKRGETFRLRRLSAIRE